MANEAFFGSRSEIDVVYRNGTYAVLPTDRMHRDCADSAAGKHQQPIDASSYDACAAGTESTVVEAYQASVSTRCNDGYNAIQPATSSCTACEFGV